jgi:hypothetical protein
MTLAGQLSATELLAATERRALLRMALEFIGEHKRSIDDLPPLLQAIDQFLRPPLSHAEILDGLRRMRDA